MKIPNDQQPIILKGIPAAPGMADGPSIIWHKESINIPRYYGIDMDQEKLRLDKAIETSCYELQGLKDKLLQEGHPDEAAVFDAHILMLQDNELHNKVVETLQKQSLNVEAAWNDAVEFFAVQLASIPDATLQARAADIRDVGKRVTEHLLGRKSIPTLALSMPSIIIARDLAPSETASLEKKFVLAFCTAEGGPTSHTAILAKALGLPAVVGLGEQVLNLNPGAYTLVNGNNGTVIVNPDTSMQADFASLCQQATQISTQELSCAHEPAISIDGHRVEIVANIGNPEEAEIAIKNGAEGVGLLRTEFLFLERQTAPDEEEQFKEYQRILDAMNAYPVIVRTIDVGGDKEIPYLNLGHENNPFLGWRAIRMCLDRPGFFKTQLRALLRASPGHDLRIMFPMIATLAEVRKAKDLLAEAKSEVIKAGYPIASTIQVGIMVEIPSIAIMAEQFAHEVNFFSIGTNDLTQYTMAAERTNPKVSNLADACHPAVLRQIHTIIQAGHTAGIWIGVCGELAGDPEAIPILLGMGLDEFSMSPRSIPHAKALIRQWSFSAAQRLAAEVVNCDSAEAVRQIVQRW